MRVYFDASVFRRTTWDEYASRFLFGGAITLIAGILAKRYGPVFGGLFLAFPAIFPSSVTLIEKHERQKKQRAGIPRTIRGQLAAALDARGAAMGSIGLACFGLVVWKLLPIWSPALVLLVASVIWFAVSFLIWRARKFRLTR
ncbi:MAG TPA: DUF3147 family protein [Verrucomicrobiae bacterium]|nr:DUF3147 family protein [Verrucomicrobiae bacterium]